MWPFFTAFSFNFYGENGQNLILFVKNWKNRPSNLILLFFLISWSFYLYLEGGCSSYLHKEEFQIRCFSYPFIHIRVTTRFRIKNSCLFRNLFPWSHSCKCMCSRRHFHPGNIRYFCMAIVCTKVLYYLGYLCLLSLNLKKMRMFFPTFCTIISHESLLTRAHVAALHVICTHGIVLTWLRQSARQCFS